MKEQNTSDPFFLKWTWVKEKGIENALKTHLACKEDINLQDREGTTLLHWAVEEKNIEIVKLIISYNANLDIKNSEGKTALIIASFLGFIELVELLVLNGADMNLMDKNGLSALNSSVARSHYDIAQLLISKGVNINLCSEEGITALHVAIRFRNLPLVKLLVSNGANILFRQGNSFTPLETAFSSEYGKTKISDYLMSEVKQSDKKCAKSGELFLNAIEMLDWGIAKFLLEEGADINYQDKNRPSALHVAIAYDERYLVELLLKEGASPNVMDNKGDTPLHIAAQGQLDIVILLLRYHPNLDLKNKEGKTAYQIAMKKNKEIAKLINNRQVINKLSSFWDKDAPWWKQFLKQK